MISDLALALTSALTARNEAVRPFLRGCFPLDTCSRLVLQLPYTQSSGKEARDEQLPNDRPSSDPERTGVPSPLPPYTARRTTYDVVSKTLVTAQLFGERTA